MKTRTALLAFFIFVFFITMNADAGSIQKFQLNDGSVITGEMVSFQNGIFTIKSGSLGVIKLKASQVRSFSGKEDFENPNSGIGGEIETLRQQMVNDTEIMSLITALQNDPELQEALTDMEFLRLIQAGDLEALRNNPRFNRIMNNPGIKKVINRMTSR